MCVKVIYRNSATPAGAGRSPVSVDVLYTTSAIAVGGRDGITGTTNGRFEVKLARPKEVGGKNDGTNPEELFASGYAACFLTSMQLMAWQGGSEVPEDAEVMATVGLGLRPEGGLGLEIALDITLPRMPAAEAEALIKKAYHVCPYSNAMRGNVSIRLGLIEA
jgi:osmotically inducible protein OsmC